MLRLSPTVALLLLSRVAVAAVSLQGDEYRLSGNTWQAQVRASDGALLRVTSAYPTQPIVTGGEFGLWQLRRQDAASTTTTGPCVATVVGGALRLDYDRPEQRVVVTLTPHDDYLEFSATITGKQGTVTGLSLPGRLRMVPAQIRRVIAPTDGNDGVGLALRGSFFVEQPQDRPVGWRNETVGGAGYHALTGGDPEMRPLDDPDVALNVSDDGRALFGPGLAGRIEAGKASVFRPSRRADVDRVLIDSPSGPYYTGKKLGQGWLYRFGGRIDAGLAGVAADVVTATVNSLPTVPARGRIGLVQLRQGPANGGFSSLTAAQWRAALSRARGVAAGQVTLTVLDSPVALAEALEKGDLQAVLNPYGEGLPVPIGEDEPAMIARIKSFVEGGGAWFEVAGYPFHYMLRPLRYLTHRNLYPAAFADFFHVDAAGGQASLYRVQPRNWQPWAGATNKADIFVPGDLACGGDEKGGWLERWYAAWVTPGQTWTAPPVRLVIGATPEQSLKAYAQLNGITRRLEDKVKPEVLARLKDSLLVYMAGSATAKTAALAKLPQPTLVHFADYLHGGFDKQYPDHLPPNAAFGTPEQMRALFDRSRATGNLISPYTNPTWWCIGPNAPTLDREGNAPLLKRLDGSLSFEKYAANAGYTVTHWHPAVQAANRLTRHQFTTDYPSDILFQDQNGARSWQWDSNPASPTPWAYSEGLLSQVDEDAAVVPLGTESGWDRVVNGETLLCGLSWALSPHTPERSFDERFGRENWTIYPMAQQIAHDKAILEYHDLGQFCTDTPTLSWALALGFSLNWRCAAQTLDQPSAMGWLQWLDRLQKSLVSPTLGQPLLRYEHHRDGAEVGWVEASYASAGGPVTTRVNLNAEPKTVAGKTLAGYGFEAESAKLRVSSDDRTGWVAAGDGRAAKVWVYARGSEAVTVELPGKATGGSLAFGTQPVAAAVKDGALSFTLPSGPAATNLTPPATLAGKAPREWPTKPSIAVIDLGAGAGLAWSTVQPETFLTSLRASKLARDGFPIRAIGTIAELNAALEGGPANTLAIVNPYGEGFPSPGSGRSKETLDRIRQYVNQGGTWWETGGYSFHVGRFATANGLGADNVGPSGAGLLGLPVGGGEVEAAPEKLQATADGRVWLGEDLAKLAERTPSPVNRGLPRDADDPGHVALLRSARPDGDDFIGGYRLDGWGWLWRVGGFNPAPELVAPVVVAALEHLAATPPVPRMATGARRLWELEWKGR